MNGEPSTPSGDGAPARGKPEADSELIRLIEEFRIIRADLDARLDRELARSRELKQALNEAERKLESIYKSRTWAVGRALRRLARPMSPAADLNQEGLSTGTDETPARSSIEAPPPHRPHPLWEEYQAETAHRLEPGGEGIVFMVSTTSFGEGRGDLFVATGLGRHLRRDRYKATYLEQRDWYAATPGARWVVALMPAFRPSKVAPSPKVIGWARNEFLNWLTHPELDRFDAILCSSPTASAELARFYEGPIHLLPIGVDLELFEPAPGSGQQRDGVVSTVNQWGKEREVYRALRSSRIDFPLQIIGQSRRLAPELAEYDRGPAHFFELPKIYWGTKIVLDDFNHTTVGWGSVNSRVFEAIAAGALPLTNSEEGLDVLGLADVPTYSAPEELNPLVDRLLGDPDGTQALVDKLGGVVRERHSYEARARDFAGMVSALD